MTDLDALSDAIANQDAIISFLSPLEDQWTYAYKNFDLSDAYCFIIKLMRKHSVSRILAISHIVVQDAMDLPAKRTSPTQLDRSKQFIKTARLFETEANDLDWILCGIKRLCWRNSSSWDMLPPFVERFGDAGNGWCPLSLYRAELATWLVGGVERAEPKWVRMKPVISTKSSDILHSPERHKDQGGLRDGVEGSYLEDIKFGRSSLLIFSLESLEVCFTSR